MKRKTLIIGTFIVLVIMMTVFVITLNSVWNHPYDYEWECVEKETVGYKTTYGAKCKLDTLNAYGAVHKNLSNIEYENDKKILITYAQDIEIEVPKEATFEDKESWGNGEYFYGGVTINGTSLEKVFELVKSDRVKNCSIYGYKTLNKKCVKWRRVRVRK